MLLKASAATHWRHATRSPVATWGIHNIIALGDAVVRCSRFRTTEAIPAGHSTVVIILSAIRSRDITQLQAPALDTISDAIWGLLQIMAIGAAAGDAIYEVTK